MYSILDNKLTFGITDFKLVFNFIYVSCSKRLVLISTKLNLVILIVPSTECFAYFSTYAFCPITV